MGNNRKASQLCDAFNRSNTVAGISTVPDGIFVSYQAFENRRIERIPSDESDFTELAGTPDMVLEVVSKSSENKDTVDFVDAYGRAEIPEYWLVDARGHNLRFDI